MNRKKIIIFFIVILVITIISCVVYFIIPKTTITFAVAPTQVNVKIDNNKSISIKNKDKINISAGKHTIIISQNEFKSYTTEVNLIKDKNKEILAALKPLTSNAQTLINKDENQAVVQRFYGDLSKQREQNIKDNFPVLAILPYTSQSFSMKMCKSKKYPNDNTKIALCIIMHRNNENIKNIAIKMLKNKGYYRDDYEIIWSQDYYNGS